MKQTDLKPCSVCGKGVMHAGNTVFYTGTLTMQALDTSAIQRQHGLEMMLGNPKLAQVMGANEDMAKPIDKVDFTVCTTCAWSPETTLSMFIEVTDEQDD